MFGSENRPFGDSYWPSGPRTHVDTFQINGSEWKVYQQGYGGGGCFPKHYYMLEIVEQNKDDHLPRKVSTSTLSFDYERYVKYLEVSKRATIEEIARRLINEKYHKGVLSKEGREKVIYYTYPNGKHYHSNRKCPVVDADFERFRYTQVSKKEIKEKELWPCPCVVKSGNEL